MDVPAEVPEVPEVPAESDVGVVFPAESDEGVVFPAELDVGVVFPADDLGDEPAEVLLAEAGESVLPDMAAD